MAKLGNPINIAAAGEAGRASLIAGANEDVIDLLPVLRAIEGGLTIAEVPCDAVNVGSLL